MNGLLLSLSSSLLFLLLLLCFSPGRPDFMEAEIITMARKGEVDEALILLLEANAQQAEAAGATAPAEVLRKLIAKANEEREKRLPDEQRLLRALIKLEDKEVI